jgi:hypothetical protein
MVVKPKATYESWCDKVEEWECRKRIAAPKEESTEIVDSMKKRIRTQRDITKQQTEAQKLRLSSLYTRVNQSVAENRHRKCQVPGSSYAHPVVIDD